MLRYRIPVGATLALIGVGAIALDASLAPWYPFLMVLALGLTQLGVIELRGLIDEKARPAAWLAHLGALLAAASGWAPAVGLDPWRTGQIVVALALLAAFAREMAIYTGPGTAVLRVAMTFFAVGYLGLLPAFLVRLRDLEPGTGTFTRGTLGLVLAVFVPKLCDIGAYTVGRAIGRHRMTPVLSPKKTWEGGIGGLATAMAFAVAASWYGERPALWWANALAFGLVIGTAGMLGDLAESMIKRDGQKKDASSLLPGFGGVLDVIDALLFPVPLAYVWLAAGPLSPLG